jgi:hypothetical protein
MARTANSIAALANETETFGHRLFYFHFGHAAADVDLHEVARLSRMSSDRKAGPASS